MLNHLKQYRLYKQSGVRWLREVPEHWAITPSRAIFREIITRKQPNELLLSVTISNGVVLQSELIAITSKKDSSNKDRSNYKLVEPGDLVYNKMRAWQGAVGVSTHRGLVSPAYIVQRLRDSKDLPRYFHYLLRTPHFAKEAERWSYGITSDQWSLRSEDFKKILFPYPPTNEQRAIVKFLDWADRRIKLIIAARKRRIQLLEEYRQVLINDAVTGKFDVRTGKPYPAYKDSGVEWLGKVPNTWSAIPVRRAYSIQLGKMLQPAPKTADDVQVPYLKAIHVQWFHIKTNALLKMWATPDEIKDYSIAPGDLLVCEGGEGGRCAIVESIDQPTIIQNALHRVRAKAGASNKFLAYVLKTVSSTGWFDGLMDKATIAHLTKEKFAALEIPFPSLSEQHAIAEYLDRETAKIDEAIEKTKKSIALWEELRTTLIADVVTGKYDVRELAEGLPEEEPELEAKIETLEASLQAGEIEADEGFAEEEIEAAEETA